MSIPDPRDAFERVSSAGREFLLRPGIAFLNHGSFGACPRPVFETYQRWQRELEAQPVEFLGRRIDDLLAEARAPLAQYVGVGRDDLVFVPNATHGMNIVARSLLPLLEPGDEVLGTDHEYGAVERTWRFLCPQRGATYRSHPLPLPVSDAEALVEQFWQGVTERTKVIVLSHITSPTALIFPVAEICRRAAEHGILTVVDGAHAPGQIDLDLVALGADFYTGNLHKWLCAPKGAGFLYARPERQALLQPLVVSWGWEAREPGVSPFQDYFGWIGTDDPAAYLSVPAAIAFQREHDWPAVRTACHALTAEAQRRIGALTGLPQIAPAGSVRSRYPGAGFSPERVSGGDRAQREREWDTERSEQAKDGQNMNWWEQMCAIPLPVQADVTAHEFHGRLWEEYQIEVPVVDWQGWRFVRVSIQAYNSERDVERLLEGLTAILLGS